MNVAPWIFGALGLAVWASLVGPMAPADAVLGLVVVWSAWAVYRRFSDLTAPLSPQRAGPRAWRLTRYFLGYVAPEVLMSTLRVFAKVLSPRLRLRPAITAVEVPGCSRSSIILLAYGISLTPGQQLVAIDEARRMLYIHTIDAPDPEAVRQRILAIYKRYLEEEDR